jgi:hypothetical protein
VFQKKKKKRKKKVILHEVVHHSGHQGHLRLGEDVNQLHHLLVG